MRKDYCGPFWMPTFMRKWLSKYFNASCKIHDLDYESKKYNRTQSDIRFLVHMLKQANGAKSLEAIAIAYYVFVRIGGRISWINSDK